MKAIKINNPVYVGKLGDHIKNYVKRVAPMGITYESLYTYFARVTQFGGELSEFWVCFDEENNPIGFASWVVLDIPHISTALFDHFYTWGKDRSAAMTLLGEYVEFMKRHNCLFFKAIPRNDGMIKYIQKISTKFDIEIVSVQNGCMIGRRLK